MRGPVERGRAAPLRAALLIVAVCAAVAVLLVGAHELGNPLTSRAASASAPAGPLLPTRLVGLPSRSVANGTEPLRVLLSAPVAANSPPPTLRPAVAGAWAAVGDAEVFTPASTLQPCAAYTLTVWANTVASGYSRLGRRHTLGLHVACPPIAAAQQALARLGYLGAVFRPMYTVRIAPGHETRREAAVHAFRPPRGRLAPHPAGAPPVVMGQLDETTREH